MNFAERLNKTRKERNFSAQQVAQQLNICLRSYRNYESGDREPSFATLVQIADLLDVSLDYLLCRDAFLSRRQNQE